MLFDARMSWPFLPNYDLNKLGPVEFERMCQSLLKEIIGLGTKTFGPGPDGGREATFSGRAAYPSDLEQWDGEWIFQAKFHDIVRLGPDKARQQITRDLADELEKIVGKYQRKCDNYILMTNVPLSSVPGRGTHDKILGGVLPNFKDRIRNIRVWGYDELCRFLESCPNTRRSYLHFIVAGDIICQLMQNKGVSQQRLTETVKLYLRTSFEREQYAQLDQAGEAGEMRLALPKIFVDLNVVPALHHRDHWSLDLPSWLLETVSSKVPLSSMKILLSGIPRVTLIGGPGQGKSTIGQYLAQMHRATLLDCLHLMNGVQDVTSITPRIPFRIILREYAQWLKDAKSNDGVEYYLAHSVADRASRETNAEDIQTILRNNPILLVLDGLDEVTERELRDKMVERINEFFARCEELRADIQVLATTRPVNYSDQFDPDRFLHLTLANLESDKVIEYVDRWIKAKRLDEFRAKQLREVINECSKDRQISALTKTPLQVTILILIILSGGTPPKQREQLFDDYLRIIYRREKAKTKWLIETEEGTIFGLHKYLGYILHSKSSGDVDVHSVLGREEFTKEVRTYLKWKDPISPDDKIDRQIAQILQEASERLVLIVEPRSGVFGFELRSLQEFFAAAHLVDTAKDTTQRFRRFRKIAVLPYWRNVALFFAGRVGRSHEGEAPLLLEVCREIDEQEPDTFLRRGAWLALELAADRSVGNNRRLQRNVIDYSLSLLEGNLVKDQKDRLENTAKEISEEDAKELLGPMLHQRMQRFQRPTLDDCVHMYYSVLGCDSTLLSFLDSLIEPPSPENASFGLLKALEFDAPSKWLAERFGRVVSEIPAPQFGKVVAAKCVERPDYVRDCLSKMSLGSEFVEAVLEEVFKDLRMLRLHFEMKASHQTMSFDLSTPANQLWTVLSLAISCAPIGFKYRGFRVEANDRTIILLSTYAEHERFADFVKTQAPIFKDPDKISTLLRIPSIVPGIAESLWPFCVALWPTSKGLMNQFIEFYKRHSESEKWPPAFFCLGVLETNPLAVALLNILSKSVEEGLKFVDTLASVSSIERIFAEMHRLKEDLTKDEFDFIIKASLLRRAFAKSPSLRLAEFKQRYGFGLDYTYPKWRNPSIPLMPREVELTVEEFIEVISGIELAIQEGDKSTLHLFARGLVVPWLRCPINEETYGICKKIVVSLSSDGRDSSPEIVEIAVALSLKMIAAKSTQGNHEWKELVRDLLSVVGRHGGTRLLILLSNKSEVVLQKLSTYASDADQTVRLGAAAIASEILSDIVGSRHVSTRDDVILRSTFFDWNFAKELVESSSPQGRINGIRILSVSNLSLNREGDWIIRMLKSCRDVDEEKEWRTFLIARRSKSRTSMRDWINLLSEILRHQTDYRNRIVLGALERYDRILSGHAPGLGTEDESWGLPLSH